MKIKYLVFAVFIFSLQSFANPAFKEHAQKQNPEAMLSMPVQNNGRLKPFDTFTRETILFITGKYKLWGISAPQVYLGLINYPEFETLEIIDVRSPALREKLGLDKSKKLFSIQQLDQTPLSDLAQPLMLKKEMSGNDLTEEQKKIMESFHQVWMLRQIQMGEHLAQAININFSGSGNSAHKALMEFIAAPSSQNQQALVAAVKGLEVPDEFKAHTATLDLEVLFNKLKPFWWAALGYLLLAAIFLIQPWKPFLKRNSGMLLMLIPLSFHLIGFGIRVLITGFAPVTNMYGTMLWVSFGVALFSTLILWLYSNFQAVGFLALGSAVIMLLTESIPLVLSPDMDPIVAVLRSNYWLTLHVLTITISYAAFTIAMLMGNVALVREIFVKKNDAFYKEYAHYAYRMIQLGCFLLTGGIILGGIWADYSWGRFWGWDPKETWALIADLGFLIILHARLIGWLNPFSLLAWSTMAYLLVVMAWYGVNFILASGLHSYGFSSGGAFAVGIFLCLQLGLFLAAMLKRKYRLQKA